MIDLTRIRYDVVALTKSGQRLHLMEPLRELTWEEPTQEIAGRITAVFQQTQVGGQYLHQLVTLGTPLYVLADWGQGWQQVAEGRVARWRYESDDYGRITVLAYDPLFALQQSQDDRYYPAGTTAEAILRDVFQAWGVPVGTIQDLAVPLAAQVFRGDALGDVVSSVLDQARKRGKGKRVVRWDQGKVHILKYGGNSTVWRIHNLDAAIKTDDDQDIETLVTRVRIYGSSSQNTRPPVVATLDDRTEFGVLQQVIYAESYDSLAAAKQAAQEVLTDQGQPQRQQLVETVDMPWVRRGDRVYVAAGSLVGDYHVLGTTHEATTRQMTLEVEPA